MPKKNYPQNILVFKNRALGDSVIGLGAIQYLKDQFPQAQVTYAIPRWISPLYQNVQTSADTYLPFETNSLWNFAYLAYQLKKGRYDLIVELHQSGRTSRFFKFLSFFSTSFYLGHNHNLKMGEDNKIFEQGVRKAIIQRDLDTAWSAVKLFYKDQLLEHPHYLHYAPKIVPKAIRHLNQKRVIFGVVATRKEKKWPLNYFAKLARMIESYDQDIKIIIPLSSSAEDNTIEKKLREKMPSNVEFLKASLDQLPIELSGAYFYLGNDTGLKHICAALGMPTLTLFGPEEPIEWHPYDLNKHKYFWVHGHDLRTQMNLLCMLKQFDQSRKLSEVFPEEVFRHLPWPKNQGR